MVQILTRKRQCGAQARAKSFGAVQFWPSTVQINHSFLCIWFFGFCTGASFIPLAASVVKDTFETEDFQRSTFEHSRSEFQFPFHHTWSVTRGENLDPVIHLHPFPLC